MIVQINGISLQIVADRIEVNEIAVEFYHRGDHLVACVPLKQVDKVIDFGKVIHSREKKTMSSKVLKSLALTAMLIFCGVVEAKPEVSDGDFLTSFMDGLANGSVDEVCYEREMQFLMGNGELYRAANAMAILRSIDSLDPKCINGAIEASVDYKEQMEMPIEDFEEYVAN